MQTLKGEYNQAAWGKFTILIHHTAPTEWSGMVYVAGELVHDCGLSRRQEDIIRSAARYIEGRVKCSLVIIDGERQPLEDYFSFEEKGAAS